MFQGCGADLESSNFYVRMESEPKVIPPDEDDVAENLIDDETYEGFPLFIFNTHLICDCVGLKFEKPIRRRVKHIAVDEVPLNEVLGSIKFCSSLNR